MRRWVRLRPVEPDVMKVTSVLMTDDPPADPLVVAAPPNKTDEELLHLAKSGDHWVPEEYLSRGAITRRGPVKSIARGELMWNGYLYNLSGYAKANREVLFRCQKDLKIQLVTGDYLPETMNHPEPSVNNRLLMAEHERVSPDAPILRFFLPRREMEARHRILWFMTETETMHPRLVARIEAFYDEVWFPTQWNIDSFLCSGGKTPSFRMPLGVDPVRYHPAEGMKKARLPVCERIGKTKGSGIPSGFVFLYVFQPVFRKGAEFLVRAFEKAFGTRQDVHLVLATTGYPTAQWLGKVQDCQKSSNVWLMKEKLSESRMSELYRAADAYVCSSLGEGFNLPAFEAAASGLPVIAPRHTAHLDFLNDENSYLFDTEGHDVVEGAKAFCTWYDDMPFARFREKSESHLVSHLWDVVFRPQEARIRAARLRELVTKEYTWGKAAERVISRLSSLSSPL